MQKGDEPMEKGDLTKKNGDWSHQNGDLVMKKDGFSHEKRRISMIADWNIGSLMN